MPFPTRREWSADEIKRIGYCVVDTIAEHLMTLPEALATRGWSEDDSSFDWNIKPLVRVQSSSSLSMSPPSEAPHSPLLP